MREPQASLDLLAQRQRWSQLGKAAAEIVHEVRQPLFIADLIVARATSNLESKGDINGTKLLQDFTLISANISAAQKLISQMGRYANADDGPHRECNPIVIISEVLKLNARMARDNEIQLLLESDWPNDMMIQVSDLQLRQVMTNLVNNACDAIRLRRDSGNSEPVLIHITLSIIDDAIEILCADNGIGIPPQIGVRDIFKRSVSSKKKIGGSGLGLYITRRIVRALGGSIDVIPKDGGGTAFLVTLPSTVIISVRPA